MVELVFFAVSRFLHNLTMQRRTFRVIEVLTILCQLLPVITDA